MNGPRVPPAPSDPDLATPADDGRSDDSVLDSLGKAITSPVRSAADPEEPKPGDAPPAPG